MIVYQKRYTNSNFIPRIADKPISFELSLGNAGNSLDGQLTTVCTSAHLFSKFSQCQNVQIFTIKIVKLRRPSDNNFAITRIFFFLQIFKTFETFKMSKYSKYQSIQNVKNFKMSKFSNLYGQLSTVCNDPHHSSKHLAAA